MGVIARTAQRTADSKIGSAFIRWGHVIRGGLYITMGILAIEWASGQHGLNPAPAEAINLASRSPFGKVLLILIILGLIGYAGWGLVRMTRKNPIWIRIGYFFSTLGYASLIWPAVILLRSGLAIPDAGWGAVMNTVINPLGQLVFILAGLGTMIGGVIQVWLARGSLVAKFGILARGVLMMLAGMFLLATGWLADPGKPHSFAQVLIAVGEWQFGPPILAAIGAGFVALGAYSLVLAKKNEHT